MHIFRLPTQKRISFQEHELKIVDFKEIFYFAREKINTSIPFSWTRVECALESRRGGLGDPSSVFPHREYRDFQ